MSVNQGKQKSRASAATSVVDPGCVKTCTRGECAELFSLFSSFDGARQSGSFLIRRSRDKRSTRKFGVGVFTQPGPICDFAQQGRWIDRSDNYAWRIRSAGPIAFPKPLS